MSRRDNPEYDFVYLRIARNISSFGTCPAKHVGCVIVDPHRNTIVASGYNDSPNGLPPCGDACRNRTIGENSKACQAVHAEVNAILNAAYRGVSVDGCTLYVTISPCQSCARAIIQSGITDVVCSSMSPYEKAVDMLRQAGVNFEVLVPISSTQLPEL